MALGAPRLARMAVMRGAAALAVGLLLAAEAAYATSAGPVYRVGPDEPYQTPSVLADVVPDGAVIEIAAGQYLDTPIVWRQSNITIRGTGGFARFVKQTGGSVPPGFWTFEGDGILLENLWFSEFSSPARDATAVLHSGGRMTIRGAYFYRNDNAVRAAGERVSLTIEASTFDNNGARRGAGHTINVVDAARLVVRASFIQGAAGGAHIRSAARTTEVLYNRLTDGLLGEADAIVDASGSETAHLVGNVVHKSSKALEGDVVVHRGAPSGGLLAVLHNTIVTENAYGVIFTIGDGVEAQLVNNLLVGKAATLEGEASELGTMRAPEDALYRAERYNYQLRAGASAIDAAAPVPDALAHLAPRSQYAHPLRLAPRPDDGKPDVGALEHAAHNPWLTAMPANRWIRIESYGDPPRRHAHAGLVYDERRGRLVTFGSETHGFDWDNAVHEFDPVYQTWRSHQESSAPSTYRTDAAGRRIAGREGTLMPWPMHTYDNMVYDPQAHTLVVTSSPKHNPHHVGGANPIWVYDLEAETWTIHENAGAPPPVFFGGGSIYDSRRDTIVAYGALHGDVEVPLGKDRDVPRGGVWELGPDRARWTLAHPANHHKFHYMLEYEPRSGTVAVFGDFPPSARVWVYTPGPRAGVPGEWEARVPAGEGLPASRHYPVAYDQRAGVFLLLPDEPNAGKTETYVYDLATNRTRRIPGAEMFPLWMNYMMVYDSRHGVFLLITGGHTKDTFLDRTDVWAFRLDLDALAEAADGPAGRALGDAPQGLIPRADMWVGSLRAPREW